MVLVVYFDRDCNKLNALCTGDRSTVDHVIPWQCALYSIYCLVNDMIYIVSRVYDGRVNYCKQH
jgi:hypothetical protein